METVYPPCALTSLALGGDCADCSRPVIHLILNAIPALCAYVKHELLLDAGRAKERQAVVGEDAVFGETSENASSSD